MAKYSLLERKFAQILSKFPFVKKNIKIVYQKINFFRYKKNYTCKAKLPITEINISGNESFFGYYDKSPINIANDYVIFHSSIRNTRKKPSPTERLDIAIFDLQNSSYKIVGSSSAYNWQQGSKLMWLDQDNFIYNDYDNIEEKYISKIYNIESEKEKRINFPIYDCYGTEFAISLNFDRLDIARADYGYKNSDTVIDWSDNKSDGLFYIDLTSNTARLIISLDEIININYKATMSGAKHKFNHVMISPCGNKMMFMHRWFLSDGRRFDTLYVANIDGTDIKIIADDDMVSHCFWFNDSKIVAYLRDAQLGDKYYLIDLLGGNKNPIGLGTIDQLGDGHPHTHDSKIIFDTYPDKARMKSLFLYDFNTGKLEVLGEFLESFDFYNETRCDLHPRFSFDGRKVFFDSVHQGKRRLYMMELDRYA